MSKVFTTSNLTQVLLDSNIILYVLLLILLILYKNNIGRENGQSQYWYRPLYLEQTTGHWPTSGSQSFDWKNHKFFTGILRSGQISMGGHTRSRTYYGNPPITTDCRGEGDCVLQNFPQQHYGFSSFWYTNLTIETISHKIMKLIFFSFFSLFKGDFYNSQQGNGNKYLHGVHEGRVEKHHNGRGGFSNGGRGGYQQAGPSNSGQEFNCLFCQINSHLTAECRKMQMARSNFLRGGHRGSSRGANRGAQRGGNYGGAFSASSQVKVEPSEMLNEEAMDETDGM